MTRISFSNGLAYKVWNSSNTNARWSFDPRNGLTLKNPTVFDSGIYYIFAHLPFVNGKPVNISLPVKISFSRRNRLFDDDGPSMKEMIRRIFPVDRIDAIDGIDWLFIVPGNTNSDITPVNL
jgi:hypothetical protein